MRTTVESVELTPHLPEVLAVAVVVTSAWFGLRRKREKFMCTKVGVITGGRWVNAATGAELHGSDDVELVMLLNDAAQNRQRLDSVARYLHARGREPVEADREAAAHAKSSFNSSLEAGSPS